MHNYKYYFIYKIVNVLNDKCYVGFHATNKEFEKDLYFGSGSYLQNAIKLHGQNNFKMSIVEYIGADNWQEKEKYWIEKLGSHYLKGGYNLTIGGDGRVGCPQSNESRLKCSKSMAGKNKGKIRSEASKENLRIKFSGENHPSFGAKRTQETKDKMRNASIGKPKSETARKNMGAWQKGKTWEEMYGLETATRMKENRKNKKEHTI